LNQKCERPRMLKNAHIWSIVAALMRALGDEDPVPGDTPKIGSDSESNHPRMSGGFR